MDLDRSGLLLSFGQSDQVAWVLGEGDLPLDPLALVVEVWDPLLIASLLRLDDFSSGDFKSNGFGGSQLGMDSLDVHLFSK